MNGGITFSKNAASAEWEGMPQSAMENGVVDFVLRPLGDAGKTTGNQVHAPLGLRGANGRPILPILCYLEGYEAPASCYGYLAPDDKELEGRSGRMV